MLFRAALFVLSAVLAACTVETRSPSASGERNATEQPAAAAPAKDNEAAIGKWGFDLSGMDTSVNPGDDFFRYASGRWLERTAIPADKSAWGMFEQLREQAEADVMGIIRQLAASPATLTSPQRARTRTLRDSWVEPISPCSRRSRRSSRSTRKIRTGTSSRSRTRVSGSRIASTT